MDMLIGMLGRLIWRSGYWVGRLQYKMLKCSTCKRYPCIRSERCIEDRIDALTW